MTGAAVVAHTLAMSEVDEFLRAVLPRLQAAEFALHEGDADPRKAVWSFNEPVTLFGAEVERTGRPELESTFEWIASRFEGAAPSSMKWLLRVQAATSAT